MLTRTKAFVDVAARAGKLGCRVPVGIALLPGNFSAVTRTSEFCFHAATPYVRSAWQTVGFEDEGPSGIGVGDLESGVSSGIRTPAPDPQTLAPDVMGCSEGPSHFSRPQAGRPDRVASTGFDASSPQVPLAVVFGAGLLAGPAWRLTVALGIVSTVLAFHPVCASPREARCDIVVERPGRGYACLEYQGDAYELVPLAREVREIWAGKQGA